MAITIMPICTNAETLKSGKLNDTVTWTYDSSKTLTIDGSGGFGIDRNTSIENSPWYDLDIENIVVGKGITGIGTRALSIYTLRNTHKIKNIKILNPDTVVVGYEAFDQLSADNVEFAGKVKLSDLGAFSRCYGLHEIELADTLIIPWRSFENSGLKKIKIPDTTAIIGEYAFRGCYLEEVTIPQKLLAVANGAFDVPDNSNLLPEGQEYYGIQTVNYGGNSSQWKKIIFEDGNSELTSAKINYSTPVTSGKFGNNVTWSVKGDTLNISGSGETGNDEYNMSGTGKYAYPLFLTLEYSNVVIDEGITCISHDAFDESIAQGGSDKGYNLSNTYYRNHMKTLHLPKSLTEIKDGAFNNCKNLTDVYYSGTRAEFQKIKTDSYNDSLNKAVIHCSDGEAEGALAEEGTVNSDISWKLYGNGTLVISGKGAMPDYDSRLNTPWYRIDTPDTLKIKKVKIGNGITRVGKESFNGCYYIESAELGNTVESIGTYAFIGCDNLKSLTLPLSLKSIEYNAFGNIERALTDIYYQGRESDYKNITIDKVNKVLSYATIHYLGEQEQQGKVTGIKLDESSISMNEGDTKKLTATIIPDNATNKNVTWASSDEKVATVSNGLITALSVGTTTITATTEDGGKTASCKVEVKYSGEYYTVNGKTLPFSGYEPNKPWDNCWTFAQNIYEKIWGTDEGDNLLRSLEKEKRKITETNVRNFILSSELGANIRVEDGKNLNEHSMILVQKNNLGFTVYHGNYDGKIAFTYYTYDEFANLYKEYLYFVYIEYPNAPEYKKTPQNITIDAFGEKTYGDNSFKISVVSDETAKLTAFTYESDNTDVAEITTDGSVTIKAAGEANITVKEPGNDEYAPFEKTVKLVVKKKAVTVKSVDLKNKTAVLDGVLAEDAEKVLLDFDKITIEQGEAVDETTSNIILKNFVLKGDKAANYEITTESLSSTIANDNIVDITITAENGVVTGAAKYIKGSSVTVTATANSGYSFAGWYVDNAAVSTESTYTFTAENDTALTAKFERIRSSGGGGGGSSSSSSCTIKLDTNGGNELKNISVKRGQTIGTITEPTKDGYVFTGWYSDKALTKPYNKDEKVTASTTLYAGWKIDPVRQLILTIGKKDATVFGQSKSNDVAPKIVNDRTMLPARFVAESLGAKVEWDGEKELVTITGKNSETGEDVTILITIDSEIAKVNGKEVKLDSPAFVENDRTYTPIRFISEQLGASVEWNEEEQQVIITKVLSTEKEN